MDTTGTRGVDDRLGGKGENYNGVYEDDHGNEDTGNKSVQVRRLHNRIAELEKSISALDNKLREARIEINGVQYGVPRSMTRRLAEDPLYQRLGEEYSACAIRTTHLKYTFWATMAALPLGVMFLKRRSHMYAIMAIGVLLDIGITWRECYKFNTLSNFRHMEMNKAELDVERELVRINEKVWYTDVYREELFGRKSHRGGRDEEVEKGMAFQAKDE